MSKADLIPLIGNIHTAFVLKLCIVSKCRVKVIEWILSFSGISVDYCILFLCIGNLFTFTLLFMAMLQEKWNETGKWSEMSEATEQLSSSVEYFGDIVMMYT